MKTRGRGYLIYRVGVRSISMWLGGKRWTYHGQAARERALRFIGAQRDPMGSPGELGGVAVWRAPRRRSA